MSLYPTVSISVCCSDSPIHYLLSYKTPWCLCEGQALQPSTHIQSITLGLWLTHSNHLAHRRPWRNTHKVMYVNLCNFSRQTEGICCVVSSLFHVMSIVDVKHFPVLPLPVPCHIFSVWVNAEMCGMEWFTSAYIKPLSIFSASMTPDFCTEAISHTLRCAWASPELTAVLDSCSACLPHLRLGLILVTW